MHDLTPPPTRCRPRRSMRRGTGAVPDWSPYKIDRTTWNRPQSSTWREESKAAKSLTAVRRTGGLPSHPVACGSEARARWSHSAHRAFPPPKACIYQPIQSGEDWLSGVRAHTALPAAFRFQVYFQVYFQAAHRLNIAQRHPAAW